MADITIRLVGVDNASDEIRVVTRGLRGVEDRSARAGKAGQSATATLRNGWAKVGAAVAAVGAATAAVKRGLDLAREGAELDYLRGKFGRLAQSIGTSGDELLRQTSAATDGLLSQAQQVELVGNLVSLGLANSTDEAVRLTRVVSGLGMDLNQLVLTLTNQTTMRFDALGVRVDGFDERLQALKASGMDADAAFREAFLQQAEAQLALVGERADSAAGSFDRLSAAWSDYVDRAKSDLGQTVAPMADALADGMRAAQAYSDALEGLNDVERRAAMMRAEALGMSVESYQHYIVLRDAVDSATQSYTAWAQAMSDTARVSETTAPVTAEQLDLITSLSDVLARYNDETASLTERKRALLDAISDLTERGWSEQSQRVRELRDELAEVDAALAASADAMDDATRRIVYDMLAQQLAAEGNYDAILRVGEGLGIVQSGAADMAATAKHLADMFAEGRISADQLADALDRLDGKRVTVDFAIRGNALAMMGSKSTLARKLGIPATARATGGNLRGWTLVGDTPGGGLTPYSELITPDGRVLPNDVTVALVRSGIVRPRSAATGIIDDYGGEVGTGVVSTWLPPVSTSVGDVAPPITISSAPATTSAPTATAQQIAQSVIVSQAAAQDAKQAAAIAQAAATTAAVAAGRRQTDIIMSAQADAANRRQLAETARQSEILEDIRQLLAESNATIVDAIRDAVQQAVA